MDMTVTKTEAETLRESGDKVERGWSPDTPTKRDEHGNVTHYCAEAAMVSVHGGNPGAWARLQRAMRPVMNAANSMNGIMLPGLVNCMPGMTKELMVDFFREAEAEAVAAGE